MTPPPPSRMLPMSYRQYSLMNTRTAAFLPPGLLVPRGSSIPAVSRRTTTALRTITPRRWICVMAAGVAAPNDGAVRALGSAAELRRAVVDAPVVVLKLHARACRACLGVAPRYRKLAHAYAGRAHFVEMECGSQPELAAELGVDQLPFFAVWRAGELVTAEAIGFSRIAHLSERVADAVE